MPAKTKAAPKRILIVDDHPMMRTGLAQLIDNEGDLKVCAEADNAGQAIDIVAKQKFDLALLDISLPDKNGLELIKDIRALCPGLPILVVSMHDEMIYAERVLRAGGRGYIMKQEGGVKFLAAIRQVLSGQIYVSQHIGQGVGTREIAEKLHLSVKTVEVHRANIKEKLALKTATELVRYAVRWVDSEGQR